MKRIFVTGTSTEVGKTLASAIITEALHADYWKPIQAGDLDNTDSHKVAALVSNETTLIHPSSYALQTPMSPHAAAEIDGVTIDLGNIKEPDCTNHLVIEGAGGLLVPLNDTATIFDLIQPNYKVIVVSRHYLGSINHTLLTLGWLQNAGFQPSLIFSGDPHPSTEAIIIKKTAVKVIGRIHDEKKIDRGTIKKYADQFNAALMGL